MKKISYLALIAISFSLPLFAVAQVNTDQIKKYSDSIITVINNYLVPVLIAIAFIVFLWGVYKYFIYNGDSDTELAKGRQFALWGIIGFVVIMSLWGIVNIFISTLNLSDKNAPKPPTFGTGTTDTTSAPPATLPSAGISKGGNCTLNFSGCAQGLSCIDEGTGAASTCQ